MYACHCHFSITGSPNSPARGWSSRGHIEVDRPPSPHRSSASWPPVCRTPASAARATGTGEQETRAGSTRQAARLFARLRTDMMRSAVGEGHGEGRPRPGPASRGWRVHLCRRRHALGQGCSDGCAKRYWPGGSIPRRDRPSLILHLFHLLVQHYPHSPLEVHKGVLLYTLLQGIL